jgi:hypothetical protein
MKAILTSFLTVSCLPAMAGKLNGTALGDDFGAAAATVAGVDNASVVGAPEHDQGGTLDRGAVYLYRYNSSVNGTIPQSARLVASDGAAGDLLGSSVSIFDNDVLAGAPGDDFSGGVTDRGSAYLWRGISFSTGTVSQTVKLEATSGASGNKLGTSVALGDGIAVVGNPFLNLFGTSVGRGAIYVFKILDTATGTVNESSILYDTAGAANDRLGSAVALWQDQAVAGAPGDDVGANADQGSLAFFRNLSAAGAVATQALNLTASDGAAGDQLGAAVAMSGVEGSGTSYVVAGAPGDDAPGISSNGSAYLYRVSPSATGSLTQHAKLTVSGAASDDNFGSSVSVSGPQAIVGAPAWQKPGFACFYQNLNSLSGTVVETLRIWPTSGSDSDEFGSSVALSGNDFVIGGRNAQGGVGGSGAAWTGNLRRMTVAATGGTVEQIGFRSRTNWIIGDTVSGCVITLASTASAELAVPGTAIRIGNTTSADNCRLIVEGPIIAAPSILVGNGSNTGNELRVSNTITAGSVTLHAGSILSGSSVIEGNVGVTGSVRPGVASRASLAVTGNVTWNQGDAWQFDLAAGNLSDTLVIQGTGSDFLKGSGSGQRSFDFLGSSQTGTYTLVTWADTTNFTAADFAATNVGGGLAATFAIVGKSLTVTIGSSLSPLEQWRQTHFGSSANSGNGADGFDFDQDGIPNLLEYALGTTPTQPASVLRPVLGQSANRLTLGFTPQVVAGLTYSVQTSPDLVHWTTTVLSGLTAGSPYVWTDTVNIGSGPRFIRLMVD